MLERQRLRWIQTLTLGLGICLYTQTVVQGQLDQDLEDPAQQYHRERLAAIDADREAVVQTLAQQWASVSGENIESLAASILHNTTAEDLVTIQDATSFDQIRTILLNAPAGETVTPLTLGDLNEDLVYTPVTPCRIVDTRFGGGGVIQAGKSRTYWVHGNIASQGGNPAGCPSPRGGDPRAVHVNVTVVPVGGNGFVKVYPKGTAEPNASLVNFKKGTNIANAATIKTCFNCGHDIKVTVKRASAHVIIDVLGFYFPADQRVEERFLGFNQIIGESIDTVGSISIVAPGPGTIVVRATGNLRYGSAQNNKFGNYWIGEDKTTFGVGAEIGMKGTVIPSGTGAVLFIPASDERHFAVTAAGTYTYHFNVQMNFGSSDGNINTTVSSFRMFAQYIP